VRAAEAAGAFLILCVAPAPAAAAQTLQFDIRPGRLSDALVALGEQARITIDASDPVLATLPSRAVRGRMTVDGALARLLAGTGYSFRFVAPGAVRIVRRPVPPPRRL